MDPDLKDTTLTEPDDRLDRLNDLVSVLWSTQEINKLEFRAEAGKGRWVAWVGDPL